MRPARSRRVQAQRKFAQGAYVPPNAVAAAPADNRRDAVPDPSNVTRNHMSAPNLLDVVSLHSASSSSERQGLHNHLTSQPVVLLERLRGRQRARGLSPQPATSQRDTSQPRPIECQDARVPTTPIEGLKLQTAKKEKECKRVHPMSLRSRRLSQLELNKIISQSSAPQRKVTFKRKKNSSDEDEPLIYQKAKNRKVLQTKHSLKRTAARESAPLVGILKQSSPMASITEQYVPKDPTGIAKQSVPKKQCAPKVSTNKHSSPEKSPKKKQRRTNSPEKSLKKKGTKKSTPEQSSSQKFPKKLAKKNKTNENEISPIQVTRQKRNSEPAPVLPVLVGTFDVEAQIHSENWEDFDVNSAGNRVTPDDSIISDVPDDHPLDTDTALRQGDELAVNDMDAKEGALAIDVMLAIESTLDIEDKIATEGALATEGEVAIDGMVATERELALDDTVAKQAMLATEGEVAIDGMFATEPELALGETVAKEGMLAKDGALAIESTLDIDDMIATEGARAFDVLFTTEGELALEDKIAKEGMLAKEDDLAINGMLATEGELALDDTVAKEGALVNDGMLATKSTLDIDGGAADEAVISSVQVISSLEEDDDPMDEDLISLRFDTNSEDELAEIDKVDNMAQDLDDISEFLEGSVNPCDPVVTSDVTLENAIKDLPGKRVVSPEPGPSGMQYQFSEYDSDTEEQEEYYSNTKMYLDNNIPERYFKEVFHKTALNLELERKRKLQKKTCVGASLRSDRDVINDNVKGQNDSTVCRKVSAENRRMSMSSDSELSDSSITPEQETTNRVQHHKIIAAKRRLAKAKLMHDRIREEKEREIAALEAQKQAEIARIMAEKNICEAEISRYQERFTSMLKEKEREFARLKIEMREKLRAEIEANRSMVAEVDGLARDLENERDAKSMNQEGLADEDSNQPGTSGLVPAEAGVLVDAPVYHPTLEEFADPLKFYEKIWPEAVRFGICKIVPPADWQPPPPKLDDDMTFYVTNQFVSRLLSRWGPASRELCAIKLCLLQQNISINRLPSLDGVEINLPKLYHIVQRHGGLEQVINRKRWGRVAEDMHFTKGAGTERKLDQIYVKYLLPYDTLSHKERQEIMAKVESAWRRKNEKLFDRAMNPLYRQQRMLGAQEDSEEETEDPDTLEALSESEDCIIKGSSMTISKFRKVATFAYESAFGQGSESGPPLSVKQIEEEYWRLVTHGAEHTCVNSAAIDTGEEGYGFTKNKDEPYGSHPWNPKMVSQNRRNVLSYLDGIIGLTVPTLLLGMLYATSCWHKDPHQIAWIEYELEGSPRIWYGIPEIQAGAFRKAVEILCPTSAQNKSLWLPTDITMIPPDMLRQHNVTLSRVEQRPGEFVMVFPNAYTCCISTGYTAAESVYFAPPSWLKRLWTVFKETRESCEPTMFSMEHLLYNIGRDPTADEEILQTAQPLFERMLHEEVTNRQMLQERGIAFVQELQSDDATPSTSSGKKRSKQYIPRDQEECEYCRATLYLSKVKGLTGRNTLLCLEHALMVLDTEKYRDADVSHVQVLVHVSVKELNTVNDDMKRRLGNE